MTAPVRFPRFFVTSPAPCPYLEGKTERKVFTELKGPHAEQLNEALGRIGFRRSQTVAYRPSCIDCQACVSVRVSAEAFEPSKTQTRNLRRNGDLVVTECRPWATEEQFELLQRYLGRRHPGGGMTAMDEMDFADMVEHTPVSTFMTEYREPADGLRPGRLVGACLTDRQADGLSMVYSFYDPEHEARTGLGSYIILEHIRRAAEQGLPYVYLGYWVDGSERMQYKIRYRPIEQLGRDGWRRLGREEQEALIARAVARSAAQPRGQSGAAKDGAQDQYRLTE
ncbi:arginyltransferase [Altererythrobacter sp. H2]|uniref:arginyltransferase n=1 Tax=Altererythrobacter sp. H2 TaxID=3108391 RepID=UPI002B4BEDF7|nr:arginyltransferase [Altererythrobacter sp. H2]WRK95373.1 arginyltransferase [Altererythrobacter sp. H2]